MEINTRILVHTNKFQPEAETSYNHQERSVDV